MDGVPPRRQHARRRRGIRRRGPRHLGGRRERGRRLRAGDHGRRPVGGRPRPVAPSGEIELVEAPLDDFWMRDIGPTFVSTSTAGSARWTGPSTAGARTPGPRGSATTASRASSPVSPVPTHLPSPLVNEGGGIHVDGEGTVLVTETVQLDPRRNPYTTKQRVEWELQRTIGATKRHLAPARPHPRLRVGRHPRPRRHGGDLRRTGPACCCTGRTTRRTPTTRSCARFARCWSRRRMPRAAAWRSSSCPHRDTLRDDDGFVDWNYANHLVVNGGVIACGYGEPDADARAAAILGEAYGREWSRSTRGPSSARRRHPLHHAAAAGSVERAQR